MTGRIKLGGWIVARGVNYYPDFGSADAVRARVGAERVVFFTLGWAVQWHKSGAYYGPEALTHPRGSCAWCPQVDA